VPVSRDQGSPETLLQYVDLLRIDASHKLDAAHRSKSGQFFTSIGTARIMASMFSERSERIGLLDAGAGVGSLAAACVAQVCGWKKKPREVTVTAYEIEPLLIDYLQRTLGVCKTTCDNADVKFDYEIIEQDFIVTNVMLLRDKSIRCQSRSFNMAIVNPPYRKIGSESGTKRLLRTVGIDAGNLYTAFLSLLARMLGLGSVRSGGFAISSPSTREYS